MKIPLECFECGRVNYIDFNTLEQRPVRGERKVKQFSFVCDNCKAWEHSHFENTQISRRLKSIERMDKTSADYQQKLGYLWVKFDRLQNRLRKNNGSCFHKNLASP